MGKRLDPLDMDAAVRRVIEAAFDVVEERDNDFPNDEVGRLADALMWLTMVQRNIKAVPEKEE